MWFLFPVSIARGSIITIKMRLVGSPHKIVYGKQNEVCVSTRIVLSLEKKRNPVVYCNVSEDNLVCEMCEHRFPLRPHA